ncbi:hypothetical protein BDW71DRAFT_209900 [Aspergillus fruticulosus]
MQRALEDSDWCYVKGAELEKQRKISLPKRDIGSLRARFRSLRDEEKLRPGAIRDVFFYVMAECRDSWQDSSAFPWLFWAIDHDWALEGADQDG